MKSSRISRLKFGLIFLKFLTWSVDAESDSFSTSTSSKPTELSGTSTAETAELSEVLLAKHGSWHIQENPSQNDAYFTNNPTITTNDVIKVPKIGMPCSGVKDFKTCLTNQTLLFCVPPIITGKWKSECTCVTNVDGIMYKDFAYNINMKWNNRTNQCESLHGSVCNTEIQSSKKSFNKLVFAGIELLVPKVSCNETDEYSKQQLVCVKAKDFPEDHGFCRFKNNGMSFLTGGGYSEFVFAIVVSLLILCF